MQPICNPALKGGVVSITLRPHTPPGKTRYCLYRRVGGPQGRVSVRGLSCP